MSQPAHVRNDPHPPWDTDIYEFYTEELFGTAGRPLPTTSPYDTPAVDLGEFDTARRFWANAGRGIAEFTSRNFVSMDTNFSRTLSGEFEPDSLHPLPIPTTTTRVTLADLGIAGPFDDSISIAFVGSQVHDAYSNATTFNERASTYSLFSSDLMQLGYLPRMTLNRFNFEKNYEILFPRAIAYSAGLINYYFRGRLEVEELTYEDSRATVTIRNVSAPDFSMASRSGVVPFSLYYDDRTGLRRRIELDTLGSTDERLDFDETRSFSFQVPTDLDFSKEKPYLLVFDGEIGTEPGIAALSFGAPSTGIVVEPNYAAADGIVGARTIAWGENGWALTDRTGEQAGTIDWKGHNAADVLTWGSSPRRYGSVSGGGTVYMNGRALTRGPGIGASLLGASIRYVNGERILNLVKGRAGIIYIYSRKFAEEYDNEEMWSPANPLGWRLVYSGSHGYPFTGFFFNASGNEGQYITRHIAGEGGPLRRVKINLTGFSGLAIDFPAVATVTREERDFVSEQFDVTIGAGVCRVRTSEPNGELIPDPEDPCRTTAMGGQRTTLGILSTTESFADSTLFCVDYRGDEEVFCELMPPDSPLIRSRTSELGVQADLRDVSGATCGAESAQYDVSHTIRDTENTSRIMRIGNAEVPWTTRERGLIDVNAYAGSFLRPADYDGSVSSNGLLVNRTTHLIHADARYDFAVYESRTVRSVGESSGVYDANTSRYPLATSHVNTTRREVILVSGSQSQILFEDEDVRESSSQREQIRGTLPNSLGGCAQRPLGRDTVTSSTFPDSEATADIYSTMSSAGSYVIDRAGRLALSQRIRFVDPVEDHGYRNVLTDGDLPTLIPGAAPAAGYSYEFQLIR